MSRNATASGTRRGAAAPYALARGVPALQADPSRVRRLIVLSALLALLGGAVTGYVWGRQAAPPDPPRIPG